MVFISYVWSGDNLPKALEEVLSDFCVQIPILRNMDALLTSSFYLILELFWNE